MEALESVGKYRLLRKIATGGMAEVFLAQVDGPAGFQKTLVLKRILPNLAEDQQFVSMFLNEARLAALLNHPNIVQIFDLGEAQGSYYIAMEHIDGPNLRGLVRTALKAKQWVAFEHAAAILAKACEGLHYAHEFVHEGKPLNLIHRDISPDNVMISRSGAVKVVDFGIAKAADQGQLTKTGTVKGKIAYMCPEQLRGKTIDRRADVYALGVVLYEVLAAARLFKGDAELDLMKAILNQAPPSLRDRRPDCPDALLGILERALAKDRDQRYPDCRAMQQDLERFVASRGSPIGAYELAQLVTALIPEAPAPGPNPSRPPSLPPHSWPPTPSFAVQRPGLAPKPENVSQPPPTRPTNARPEVSQVQTNALPGSKSGAKRAAKPDRTVRRPRVVARLDEEHDAPDTVVSAPPRPRRWLRIALAGAVGAVVLGGGVAAYLLLRAPGGATVEPASQEGPAAAPAPTPKPPQRRSASPRPQAATAHPAPAARPAPQPPAPTPQEPPAKPPEAPAPAAPTTASLVVETDPPCQIVLNGKVLGTGKAQARDLLPGKHQLLVRNADKGLLRQMTLTLEAGPVHRERVVFGTGTLVFRVRPWATVEIDGKVVGTTPLPEGVKVYEGQHRVRLFNSETRKEQIRTVWVTPGKEETIKVSLE